MNVFEFVKGSHETYPEDLFISESLLLCFDGKYRVAYVRKKNKSGGLFWDVISAAVKQNGQSKFLKSFSQDSNFLSEDIKHFLDSRSWEKGGKVEKSEQLPF